MTPPKTPHGQHYSWSEWEDIVHQLTAYANFLLRHATLRLRDEVTILGMMPGDFAQNAITKYLSGDRRWNPEKCPSFVLFLKGIVRSDLSESFRKAARMDRTRNTSDANFGPDVAGGVPDILVYMEVETFKSWATEQLALRDDPVLNVCWEALLAGGIPPRELAKLHGLPVQDVYNGQRRLKLLLAQGIDRLDLTDD